MNRDGFNTVLSAYNELTFALSDAFGKNKHVDLEKVQFAHSQLFLVLNQFRLDEMQKGEFKS